MLDPPTIDVSKSDVTLFQSLGDPELRRPCLILYSSAEIGKRFTLDTGVLVIGRTTASEIQIDCPGISRRHAELSVSGDHVTLRDLGSSNGTLLNETPVGESAVLKDGDLIRLGNVVLKYYDRQSLDALLHDRIYRLATIDAGTEVFSKKYVVDALEREIRLARRQHRALSIVCFDLDHFKAVNDTFGHVAGDQVLRDTAVAVCGAVRSTDIVGRIGGEEFVVVLPDTELAAAIELAERMRAAVAAHVFALRPGEGPAAAEHVHRQSISLGAAQLGPQMKDARDLLHAADTQLYAAKRSGRNRVNAAV
jgi:two-component system cell cycle response regulator